MTKLTSFKTDKVIFFTPDSKYPEAIEALNMLEDQFRDEQMQKLNLSVDEGGSAKTAAEDILREKGLIK